MFNKRKSLLKILVKMCKGCWFCYVLCLLFNFMIFIRFSGFVYNLKFLKYFSKTWKTIHLNSNIMEIKSENLLINEGKSDQSFKLS